MNIHSTSLFPAAIQTGDFFFHDPRTTKICTDEAFSSNSEANALELLENAYYKD